MPKILNTITETIKQEFSIFMESPWIINPSAKLFAQIIYHGLNKTIFKNNLYQGIQKSLFELINDNDISKLFPQLALSKKYIVINLTLSISAIITKAIKDGEIDLQTHPTKIEILQNETRKTTINYARLITQFSELLEQPMPLPRLTGKKNSNNPTVSRENPQVNTYTQ